MEQLTFNEETIVDFWTVKCTKCPNALKYFNEVSKSSTINFVGCLLNESSVPSEIIEYLTNIKHICVSSETKKLITEKYNFKSVPFYIHLDVNNNLINSSSNINNILR